MEITAKVIQDSVSTSGARVTTLELEYPRFIHSEFMTHRVFSRNAASSRAIPVKKMIAQVRSNPAMPVHWGANRAGMQAGEEIINPDAGKFEWRRAANHACIAAERMLALGLHKQVANRILEPFQMMKTVVTATDWDNFFELRTHGDAQPEIQELANTMKKAMDESNPMKLYYGEWHVPYVDRGTDYQGNLCYMVNSTYLEDGIMQPTVISLTEEEALMVSASCCAQVSYRLLDDSLDKAQMIFDKLINSEPMHASPFEHQAKASPMASLHPSNLKGFIQYRKLLAA